MELKYRVVGSFQLLFIRAEEIEGDRERLRLLFASPVRLGSGDSARNLSAKDCAGFIGPVFKTKIARSIAAKWKQQGLSIKSGNYYQVDAAVDNFMISDKSGRSKDGLWFEILGAPELLQEPKIFVEEEFKMEDVEDVA